MISSQLSHLAQSPCMRLGASMGSGVVAMRGFLENQAMKGALIPLPRARQLPCTAAPRQETSRIVRLGGDRA